MPIRDPRERFWSKVVKTEGCWEWNAGLDHHGYGAFFLNGGMKKAHRVAYEWEVGSIPGGLDLDHLCRNRKCVKPEHLDPVTRRENLDRGEGSAVTKARHAAKTHCPRGHPYSGENLRMKGKNRLCRTCGREAGKARRQDLKRGEGQTK